MFCQKCGNKLEENIAFCPRCGARLPIADAVEWPVGNVAILDGKKADEIVQSIKTASKACKLLRENAALCQKIQSFTIKEYRSKAVVVGKINKYSIQILNGQIGLNWFPVFPFVLPIIAFILSIVLYAEVSAFGIVLMLLSGLSGIGVSVFGNKEKKIVLPFIRKALGQPKYIEQATHIEMIAYSMVVFCSALMILMELIHRLE